MYSGELWQHYSKMFKNKFEGLKSIVGILSRRTIVSTGETSEENRYYVTSLGNERPEEIANAIRKHWGIENNLHWQLDFTFREDESRKVKMQQGTSLLLLRLLCPSLKG